jgi:hypothetical protein
MGHDHRSINDAHPWSLILPILFSLLVVGCTSTPKLAPSFQPVANHEKIQKSIGVFYAPEFRDYKYVADPYQNKHNVEFLVGAASVELFQSVFSHTFSEVKELDTLAYGGEHLQSVNGVIEPRIKSFKFYSRMAGRPTYWADVTYEIALTQPEGGQATGWQIRGTGENSGDSLFSEERSWANPVELAMQDAATQMATSFQETPEAVRWLRGMPAEGATAPMESQTAWTVQDQSTESARVGYKGIISARAVFNIEADPEVEKAQAKMKEKGLVAVGLYLRNEGNHALRVRRSDISLANPERKALGPIPCSFFAAAATTYNVRLPNIVGGTGYAALPQLVFALINLGFTHEEQRESGNYSATFKKYEFADVVLKEGETAKGALFYAFTPGDLSTTDLFLLVPVVDLDSATRYVLKIPVQ